MFHQTLSKNWWELASTRAREAIFWLTFLTTAGCTSGPGQPASQILTIDSAAKIIPCSNGKAGARIDGIDIAVGPGETLHLVWRQAYTLKGRAPEYRTFYCHGEAGSPSWSAVESLSGAKDAPPRIFRGRGGVYLLEGLRLNLSFRADGGSWRELGEILPQNIQVPAIPTPGLARFHLAVDAAADDEGLSVVYLGARKDNPTALGLFLVRWNGQGLGSPHRFAEFPSTGTAQHPAPRLLVTGERYQVLAGVAEELRKREGSGTAAVDHYSTRARLFYSSSDDRGRSWLPPVELTVGSSADLQEIDDLDLLDNEGGLVALFAARGIYCSRSSDGRLWTEARQIAGFRERPGASMASWSLSAAGGALAWIDQRFQSSSRRWWKPLGGWPWSDDPEGEDNDVFILSVPALRSALAGERFSLRRVTLPNSSAFEVRLRASKDRLYLVWSGRGIANEPLDSRGATPQIFYRILTKGGQER